MKSKQPLKWKKAHSFFITSAPKKLQRWLTDRHSLTRRLICACQLQNSQFQVRVHHEAWAKPQLNESRLLNMKNGELGFIRQVHLYCGETPWVYARTVIPQSTLHGELQKLTNLGTQPLGAVLFANRHIMRSDIEIAKITRRHNLYNVAVEKSNTDKFNKLSREIWGRRSVFTIGSKPLLVSEIFLPDLI